jgi:hypothetical protein
MRKRGVQAWELRRNVLRRDLRAAVRELSQIAEQRAAAVRKRRAGAKFRPLSNRETEAIVGADLIVRLAAAGWRA